MSDVTPMGKMQFSSKNWKDDFSRFSKHFSFDLPYNWYHQRAKDAIDVGRHGRHQYQTTLESTLQKSHSGRTVSDSRNQWKDHGKDAI